MIKCIYQIDGGGAIMSCGSNITYFRKKLNITQEALAEKLDVTRQTVSRWENDSAFPETEKLIELCNLFNCSMDLLVRGNAEEKSAEANNLKISEPTTENKSLKKEKSKDAISGIIMSVCTLIFLFLGFVFGRWHPAWVVFPIGAILCGIISHILDFNK
jgi:transcriptional regulator with XRE-family HTH domain